MREEFFPEVAPAGESVALRSGAKTRAVELAEEAWYSARRHEGFNAYVRALAADIERYAEQRLEGVTAALDQIGAPTGTPADRICALGSGIHSLKDQMAALEADVERLERGLGVGLGNGDDT